MCILRVLYWNLFSSLHITLLHHLLNFTWLFNIFKLSRIININLFFIISLLFVLFNDLFNLFLLLMLLLLFLSILELGLWLRLCCCLVFVYACFFFLVLCGSVSLGLSWHVVFGFVLLRRLVLLVWWGLYDLCCCLYFNGLLYFGLYFSSNGCRCSLLNLPIIFLSLNLIILTLILYFHNILNLRFIILLWLLFIFIFIFLPSHFVSLSLLWYL